MIKKFLITGFLFLGFLIFPKNTEAAINCELGDKGFDPVSRTLQVCVGGFSTPQDLQSSQFTLTCVIGRSGICANQVQNGSLSGQSVSKDQSGNYFTCISLNVRSDWDKANVVFEDSSGNQICSIPNVSIPSAQEGASSTITKKCPGGGDGIDTAIGCIPISDTNSLISFILRWALGIAGGIAFLLVLVAGFQIMTSRGDPNRLKAGQELLTSAIAGLVLLIFSIFILRVIGFNILGITAFGGK